MTGEKQGLHGSEEERAVVEDVLHLDRLVEADRRPVLGPDEQADRGDPGEEETAEVTQPAGSVPLPAHGRIDPDLLQLDRGRGPGRRLRLEEDRPVLDPEPGSPLLDLRSRAPAEALRIPLERIDAELLRMCCGAGGDQELEVVECCLPEPRATRSGRLPQEEHGLPRPVLARAGKTGPCLAPELADCRRLPDQHARRRAHDIAREPAAAAARGDCVDSDMAERRQVAVLHEPDEAAEPASRHVLQEDALDGILGAERQNLIQRGIDELACHARRLYGSPAPVRDESVGFRSVPIHLRASPGDYAEACLLPGDPLRAKHIAETFLTDVVQVNEERGLLGYTGRWEGKPVSVQGTGMGCPGAAIVFEELIQLGVTRLLRVGTCGGLQADHALGDLIVALTAVPADSTAAHLVGNEPHCPTASWELVHEAVHVAKTSDLQLRVGPIVSSDLFYNPDGGQYQRWSTRGILAVEMEAAVLFTLGALRGVQAGCLLTVSDIVVEGEFVRISDEELRAAVDRMTRIALDTATAGRDGH